MKLKSLKNRQRIEKQRAKVRAQCERASEARALDVGAPIDLAKELRKLNRQLRKEGKPTVKLSKYGLNNDVDRDAVSSLGMSPDPREWNHNHEETKWFKPKHCKPMPERSGREAS